MSSRRQYSSCDPCRRLKRKCVYEETTPRPGLACLRCKELGYNCTFDYVLTRVEQKKRKRYSTNSGHKQDRSQSTELTSTGELVGDLDTVDWNSVLQPHDGDISLGFDNLNDSIVTGFLNLESLGKEWQDLATVDSAQPSILDTNSTSSDYTLPISLPPQNRGSRKQSERALLSSAWKGTPTQLLNSIFTAKSLGTCLYHTYATMMHGMESRYLEYECNPFGPSQRYTFDLKNASLVIEDSGPSNEAPGPRMSAYPLMGMLQGLRHLRQGGSPQDVPLGDSIKITFVGLARFLDHFGHFYGNRLSRRRKVEDERMLMAAQQVFALQWAVTSSHETDKSFSIIQGSKNSSTEDLHAFASSWFRARSLILNATPGSSFTRVYAMILFHISVPPREAKDVAGELNDILDQCLRQFEDLKYMVDGYVKLLSSTSTYRNLLQSSVTAFQWFAYIKDTFGALLTERDLTGLRSTLQTVENFVDADVPLVCQRAVLLIYRILRQTAKVKQIVRNTEITGGSSQLVSALDLAISFVEEFNHTYDGFRNRCMADFESLSSTSKLSFAEQIGRARNSCLRQETNFIELAGGKGNQHEAAAISSVIAISKHIADMSTENASFSVSGDSGMKLPFISHHASLAPIVAVLSKSIDHVIQRIVDSETPDDGVNWMLSIKPVLSCLLDMRSTVAGSQSIQAPLSRLLAFHGDLLMECWTIDDFAELLD
ncbi:hypothetical protein EIK77_001813 [Talaromyces pinophilus]|nr:hypothetical protein EIK77_001813 [Talaromyces pinophilus]